MAKHKHRLVGWRHCAPSNNYRRRERWRIRCIRHVPRAAPVRVRAVVHRYSHHCAHHSPQHEYSRRSAQGHHILYHALAVHHGACGYSLHSQLHYHRTAWRCVPRVRTTVHVTLFCRHYVHRHRRTTLWPLCTVPCVLHCVRGRHDDNLQLQRVDGVCCRHEQKPAHPRIEHVATRVRRAIRR